MPLYIVSKVSESNWERLWQRLEKIWGVAQVKPSIHSLYNLYEERHRWYHTIHHIEHCLAEFESVRQLAQWPTSVEFALWYHDAVYDPKAYDNEAQSALLAEEVMKRAEMSYEFRRMVRSLILATTHTTIPTRDDDRLVVDIDLSILGQPEAVFDLYESQIRKEYEWVPEDQYAAGRSKILKIFLDRPSIYQTDYFRTKYEAAARANIARSLERLGLK